MIKSDNILVKNTASKYGQEIKTSALREYDRTTVCCDDDDTVAKAGTRVNARP